MAFRNLPSGGAIPMDPGARDKAVRVEQLTDSIAPSGRPVETWTTLKSPVWMFRDELSGAERFVANQLAGQKVTRWEAPYYAALDPDLVDVVKTRRLVFPASGTAQRIYDIVDAQVIEADSKGIELTTVAASRVTA